MQHKHRQYKVARYLFYLRSETLSKFVSRVIFLSFRNIVQRKVQLCSQNVKLLRIFIYVYLLQIELPTSDSHISNSIRILILLVHDCPVSVNYCLLTTAIFKVLKSFAVTV